MVKQCAGLVVLAALLSLSLFPGCTRSTGFCDSDVPCPLSQVCNRETHLCDPVQGSLNGVWGSGPQDVWAVGEGGTILHYNGRVWARVHSGTTMPLNDVWGSGPADVWVVGGIESQPGSPIGSVLHYDGTSWSTVDDRLSLLSGVWGSGPGDVWVVGSGGTVLRYPGRTGGPLIAMDNLWLSGIWGSVPDNVWLVGTVMASMNNMTTDMGIIRHFVGGGYDDASFAAPLYGVWGSGPQDVWAVGTQGTILHYDGTAWRGPEQQVQQKLTSWLGRVWGSGGGDRSNVWVVGQRGPREGTQEGPTEGIILQDKGGTWTRVPSGIPGDIKDVWGSGPGDVWAVGSGGTILHFGGDGWTVAVGGR